MRVCQHVLHTVNALTFSDTFIKVLLRYCDQLRNVWNVSRGFAQETPPRTQR